MSDPTRQEVEEALADYDTIPSQLSDEFQPFAPLVAAARAWVAQETTGLHVWWCEEHEETWDGKDDGLDKCWANEYLDENAEPCQMVERRLVAWVDQEITCDGSPTCPSRRHIHGCYKDYCINPSQEITDDMIERAARELWRQEKEEGDHDGRREGWPMPRFEDFRISWERGARAALQAALGRSDE